MHNIPMDNIAMCPIEKIEVVKNGTGKIDHYKVVAGGEYNLKRINANPERLLFVNEKPTATCGRDYVPITNTQLMDVLETAIDEIGRDIKKVEVRDYNNPNMFRADAIIEEGVDLLPGDKYNYGISITNSYDMSMGNYAQIYLGRLVCTNGLYISAFKQELHTTHRATNFSELERRLLNDMIETLKKLDGYFERLKTTATNQMLPGAAALVLQRLAIRKYELDVLKEKRVIDSVAVDRKDRITGVLMQKQTEYQFLNGITSMANIARKSPRKIEIQERVLTLIEYARTNLWDDIPAQEPVSVTA